MANPRIDEVKQKVSLSLDELIQLRRQIGKKTDSLMLLHENPNLDDTSKTKIVTLVGTAYTDFSTKLDSLIDKHTALTSKESHAKMTAALLPGPPTNKEQALAETLTTLTELVDEANLLKEAGIQLLNEAKSLSEHIVPLAAKIQPSPVIPTPPPPPDWGPHKSYTILTPDQNAEKRRVPVAAPPAADPHADVISRSISLLDTLYTTNIDFANKQKLTMFVAELGKTPVVEDTFKQSASDLGLDGNSLFAALLHGNNKARLLEAGERGVAGYAKITQEAEEAKIRAIATIKNTPLTSELKYKQAYDALRDLRNNENTEVNLTSLIGEGEVKKLKAGGIDPSTLDFQEAARARINAYAEKYASEGLASTPITAQDVSLITSLRGFSRADTVDEKKRTLNVVFGQNYQQLNYPNITTALRDRNGHISGLDSYQQQAKDRLLNYSKGIVTQSLNQPVTTDLQAVRLSAFIKASEQPSPQSEIDTALKNLIDPATGASIDDLKDNFGNIRGQNSFVAAAQATLKPYAVAAVKTIVTTPIADNDYARASSFRAYLTGYDAEAALRTLTNDTTVVDNLMASETACNTFTPDAKATLTAFSTRMANNAINTAVDDARAILLRDFITADNANVSARFAALIAQDGNAIVNDLTNNGANINNLTPFHNEAKRQLSTFATNQAQTEIGQVLRTAINTNDATLLHNLTNAVNDEARLVALIGQDKVDNLKASDIQLASFNAQIRPLLGNLQLTVNGDATLLASHTAVHNALTGAQATPDLLSQFIHTAAQLPDGNSINDCDGLLQVMGCSQAHALAVLNAVGVNPAITAQGLVDVASAQLKVAALATFTAHRHTYSIDQLQAVYHAATHNGGDSAAVITALNPLPVIGNNVLTGINFTPQEMQAFANAAQPEIQQKFQAGLAVKLGTLTRDQLQAIYAAIETNNFNAATLTTNGFNQPNEISGLDLTNAGLQNAIRQAARPHITTAFQNGLAAKLGTLTRDQLQAIYAAIETNNFNAGVLTGNGFNQPNETSGLDLTDANLQNAIRQAARPHITTAFQNGLAAKLGTLTRDQLQTIYAAIENNNFNAGVLTGNGFNQPNELRGLDLNDAGLQNAIRQAARPHITTAFQNGLAVKLGTLTRDQLQAIYAAIESNNFNAGVLTGNGFNQPNEISGLDLTNAGLKTAITNAARPLIQNLAPPHILHLVNTDAHITVDNQRAIFAEASAWGQAGHDSNSLKRTLGANGIDPRSLVGFDFSQANAQAIAEAARKKIAPDDAARKISQSTDIQNLYDFARTTAGHQQNAPLPQTAVNALTRLLDPAVALGDLTADQKFNLIQPITDRWHAVALEKAKERITQNQNPDVLDALIRATTAQPGGQPLPACQAVLPGIGIHAGSAIYEGLQGNHIADLNRAAVGRRAEIQRQQNLGLDVRLTAPQLNKLAELNAKLKEYQTAAAQQGANFDPQPYLGPIKALLKPFDVNSRADLGYMGLPPSHPLFRPIGDLITKFYRQGPDLDAIDTSLAAAVPNINKYALTTAQQDQLYLLKAALSDPALDTTNPQVRQSLSQLIAPLIDQNSNIKLPDNHQLKRHLTDLNTQLIAPHQNDAARNEAVGRAKEAVEHFTPIRPQQLIQPRQPQAELTQAQEQALRKLQRAIYEKRPQEALYAILKPLVVPPAPGLDGRVDDRNLIKPDHPLFGPLDNYRQQLATGIEPPGVPPLAPPALTTLRDTLKVDLQPYAPVPELVPPESNIPANQAATQRILFNKIQAVYRALGDINIQNTNELSHLKQNTLRHALLALFPPGAGPHLHANHTLYKPLEALKNAIRMPPPGDLATLIQLTNAAIYHPLGIVGNGPQTNIAAARVHVDAIANAANALNSVAPSAYKAATRNLQAALNRDDNDPNRQRAIETALRDPDLYPNVNPDPDGPRKNPYNFEPKPVPDANFAPFNDAFKVAAREMKGMMEPVDVFTGTPKGHFYKTAKRYQAVAALAASSVRKEAELERTLNACKKMLDEIALAEGKLYAEYQTASANRQAEILQRIRDNQDTKEILNDTLWRYTPSAHKIIKDIAYFGDEPSRIFHGNEEDIKGYVSDYLRDHEGPEGDAYLNLNNGQNRVDDPDSIVKTTASFQGSVRVNYTHLNANTKPEWRAKLMSVQGVRDGVYELRTTFKRSEVKHLKPEDFVKWAVRDVRNYLAADNNLRVVIDGKNVPPELMKAVVIYCERENIRYRNNIDPKYVPTDTERDQFEEIFERKKGEILGGVQALGIKKADIVAGQAATKTSPRDVPTPPGKTF